MQEDVEVDGEEEDERHSADLGRWQRDGYDVVGRGFLYWKGRGLRKFQNAKKKKKRDKYKLITYRHCLDLWTESGQGFLYKKRGGA